MRKRIATPLLALALSLVSFGCASDSQEFEPKCDDDSCDVLTPEDETGCFFNGEPYPAGTEVDSRVCTVEGTWEEDACEGRDELPHAKDSGQCVCFADGQALDPGVEAAGLTCSTEGTWEEFVCEGALGAPHAPESGLCTCIYNGSPYPPGTSVGPLVCTQQGLWDDSPCFDEEGTPHSADFSENCS